MRQKKIGLLCIPGLPANYGAYDQTAHQLVIGDAKEEFLFIVPSENRFRKIPYDVKNVRRIFIPRISGGIGTLLYGITGAIACIFSGARTLVFFGYGTAPFFPFLKLLGINVICNVDGIEWKRAKWGPTAKKYFKFCEWLVAKINITRIYDAYAIQDYYFKKYSAPGETIFYGSDTKQVISRFDSDGIQDYVDSDYSVVVMRLEPENSILKIVEAFSSLPSRRLKIIGPTTKYFDLNCIPIITNSKNIDYLGPIYDRQKLLLIRLNATSYIHGHTVGGTNPTLVEACHIGKPVIAHDNPYNREVLGKNNNQFFSDSSQLIDILNDVDVSLEPPRKLSSDYDWYKIRELYYNLF